MFSATCLGPGEQAKIVERPITYGKDEYVHGHPAGLEHLIFDAALCRPLPAPEA